MTRLGRVLARVIAERIGTWRFIGWQAAIFVVWVLWNSLSIHAVDKYPYILFNLIMSAEAAFTAPILLIAQNYEAKRDRETMHRIEKKLDQINEQVPNRT